MPHTQVQPWLRARSKALRRELTPPERRLWQALRGGRFLGLHFRRQVPMGAYIADFVCHEHKLVVELDGWTHAEVDSARRDEQRDRWFESRGYRVLRLPDDLITRNLESALETIEAALAPQTPLPALPRKGGGKRIAPSRVTTEGNAMNASGEYS